MNRQLSVLDAPSNLGLMPPAPGRPPGVAGMAAALRARGLVERLGAADAGAAPPPPYRPDRDPATGIRNQAAIAAYSQELADRVGRIIDGGGFPLVLGGDCSILFGPLLALRRLLATAGAAGMTLTIYDPERDPDGRFGAALADAVVAAFAKEEP